MQMIRYHPLIDGDTDGLEKVPMFLSTDKETVRQNSRMYLSEIISNFCYNINSAGNSAVNVEFKGGFYYGISINKTE